MSADKVMVVLCSISQLQEIANQFMAQNLGNNMGLKPYTLPRIESPERQKIQEALLATKGGVFCDTCSQFFKDTDSVSIIHVVENTGEEYNIHCHPVCVTQEWDKTMYKSIKIVNTVSFKQLKDELDNVLEKGNKPKKTRKRGYYYEDIVSLFHKDKLVTLDDLVAGQTNYDRDGLGKALNVLKQKGVIISGDKRGTYKLADGAKNE